MANQDQNLVYGWHTQKLGATAGQTGFSQVGAAPPTANVSTASQVSAGAPAAGPNPAVTTILENQGYAASPANITPGALTPPTIPASTVAAQNPSGLSATVVISGGTVTVVATAPAGSSTYTTVATSTPATVSVPPGGTIKMTYSVVPTSWSWTAAL